MILGICGKKVYENFSVINESNDLVSGIPTSGFTVNLFNPSGAEVNELNIIEFQTGYYRVEFIPDVIGTWYLTIYHNQYFPWGKSDDIQVYQSDFDTLTEGLLEILGLVHSNIFIDNPVYDGHGNLTNARVRIYSTPSSVGTNNDVIGTYEITSPSSGPGRFSTWQQIKQ